MDIQDFSELLIQYGEVGIGLSADFNGDFIVDADDFSLLLINFGNHCNTYSRAASAVLQTPKGGALNIANKDKKPVVSLSRIPDGGILRIRDNTNKPIFSAP